MKILAFFFLGLLFLGRAQNPTLQPFSQQQVQIGAEGQRFRVVAAVDSVWSFSASSQTLDPVLRLWDSGDKLLLANDNETRRSQNARLENWTAPAAGTYILEVASEDGRSAGEVLLTVLGGADSLALSPLPIPDEVELAAGRVFELIPAFNPRSNPITLSFGADWEEAGDNFALQMKTSDPNNIGEWLLVLGATGGTLQQTQATEDGTLERVLWDSVTPFGSGEYRVELSAQSLRLWYGGAELATLGDFRFIQANNKSLRILAMPRNSGIIRLQKPYASAAFYTEENRSEALPPAGERIYAFGDVPLRAIAELRERGYLEMGGALSLSVPTGIIETGDSGFSSTPLVSAAAFGDFVLAFNVTFGAGQPACGVSFRQSDAANFASLLLSPEGNVYLLPYHDGELLQPNLALQSPWINPRLGAENHVMLILQGEEARLFVNGYAVESVDLPGQAGAVLLTLVNEGRELSRCTYRNVWVWSLDID